MTAPTPRPGITSLSPAAGCACKLPWTELTGVTGAAGPFDLADAGSVPVAGSATILHSVDFGAPLVDDPTTAGTIAAMHALSDIYAVGGEPIAADLILELPRSWPDRESLGSTLRTALVDALRSEGVGSIGGHTTIGSEVRVGASVVGTATAVVRGLTGARAGDALVLSQPLGVGLSVNAVQGGLLEPALGAEWIGSACTSNRRPSEALRAVSCTTSTDVTGYGLLGSALAIAARSEVALTIDFEVVPFFSTSGPAVAAGLFSTLAEDTLFLLAGDRVTSARPVEHLLSLASPETSGGLLACVAPDRLDALLRAVPTMAHIGTVSDGTGVHLP